MKLAIQVFLPHTSYIKQDATLGAWDTYGVSEEMDYSLPKFPKNTFITPNTGIIGHSTTSGYSWLVIVPTTEQRSLLKIKTFPTILFYDADSQKYVASIEGTPQGRGIVQNTINAIIKATSGASTTTASAPAKKVGYGFLALLLLGFIKSRMQ
jgi:hypothetical protein